MNKAFIPYTMPEQMRDKQDHHHMHENEHEHACEHAHAHAHEEHPMHDNAPMHHRPMKLARAYVVHQPYTGLFSLEVALRVGTIFPNLFEAFPEIR